MTSGVASKSEHREPSQQARLPKVPADFAAVMKASRDGYGDGLLEEGKRNPSVVALDADLAESTKSIKFAEEFPERFFEMGISEQDLLGTAAGLAASGKIPFASSFAVFVTGIPYNVIRSLISYPSLNVKIVGSHGGLMTGEDGATHQSLEDLGLMRGIPNMRVLVPADYTEAKKMVHAMAVEKGPIYLRTTRGKTPVLFGEDYNFELGKAVELRKGKMAAIIACGSMVGVALEAAGILAKEKIECSVVNMSTIKPLDEGMVKRKAKECKVIVTAEDHSVINGLGTAVQEVLSGNCLCVPIEKIGVNDVFAESGKAEELYKKYCLDADSVARAVKRALGRCGK